MSIRFVPAVTLTCLAVASAPVLAQVPAISAAEEAGAKPLSLGLGLGLLPAGTLHVAGGGESEDTDLETAFALQPSLDYRVHPNFFVGGGMRAVFGVIPDGENGDSATQLDFLARLTAALPVGRAVSVLGRLEPGYSVLSLPDEASDLDVDDPAGFVLGFGAGVRADIGAAAFFEGLVGYQMGFQGTKISVPLASESLDVDFATRYLQFTAAFGVRI